MTRIRIITVLLGAAVLAGCSKDNLTIPGQPVTAGSYVKFYNFGVNAPSVNFYANDTKLTAVSSTSCEPPTDPRCTAGGIESTTGTSYGLLGNAGMYSLLPAGQYTLTGRIAATTDNGLAVATAPAALADGKYYSFYQSGIYNTTTKTVDSFLIEDPLPATLIDFTTVYARFVNASSNSNPMTVYAKNTVGGDSVLVGSGIAYKGASAFVSLPGGSYDVTARYAGSNTAVIVQKAVQFALARVYTVTARGDMTVTSTTAASRPILDVSPNR
jgi:hypothetical protein